MKRYYFLPLFVLLMVSTLTVAQITVKFQKPASWTAVSLYTWGPEALGGWPGATLTATNGWYTYTFPTSFTGANLIFNNAGAGEQTTDYAITTSTCLQSSSTLNTSGKYDVTVVPCTSGGITVSFQKPAAWTSVNVYAWYDTSATPPVTINPLGGWPGLALSATNGMYSYTFDGSITGVNVIFNQNGAPQTASAYVTASTCFTSDGSSLTTTSCTNGIAEIKDTPLTIYPNPIVDKLNFTEPQNIGRVSIHSLTGQNVMTVTRLSSEGVVDVKSLKAGVYFVSIDYTTGRNLTEKIIKL